MEEKIYVVSVGPGNPDYLTPAAKSVVEQTNFLAGGARNLELFDLAGKEVFVIRNNLAELKSFLQANINASPAVLASGDAGYYGILKYLRANFSEDKLKVIPGISSVQVAFARLGDTWHDAVLFSIHGRPVEDILPLMESKKIALLTDKQNSPQALANFLIEHDHEPKEMVVLDNLSYPEEYIWRGSAAELSRLNTNLHNSVVVIYNE